MIKIVAFAGTGKTTTLIKMCKENPDLKFLVVVFNKTVSENAKTVFPCYLNVNCSTAHSLACKKVGVHYKSKLCENLKPKV